jgi:hypothetical protein
MGRMGDGYWLDPKTSRYWKATTHDAWILNAENARMVGSNSRCRLDFRHFDVERVANRSLRAEKYPLLVVRLGLSVNCVPQLAHGCVFYFHCFIPPPLRSRCKAAFTDSHEFITSARWRCLA